MSNFNDAVPPKMPTWAMAAILLGFPAFFYLWSLALLHRDTFSIAGIDFFVTYWVATSAIYAAKTAIILWLLRRIGWTPSDIGLAGYDRARIRKIVVIYVITAVAVFLAIEFATTQVTFDQAKLADLPGLYPESTQKRLALLVLAFFAGISEEVTYRGFAISGFISRGVNRWLAVLLAAFPFVFQHGLKSLDQFWWFFINGLIIGVVFILTKRLFPGIVIHWMIIWLALIGIFSAIAG
jgi:uncharacterized protein